MERLNKYLSRAGVASRRAADTLISEGAITINGKVTRELGIQVSPEDVVRVRGVLVEPQKPVVYVVHKPKGVICSTARQGGRKLVTDLVPADVPVFPVGRLDVESEGLIILTNDGELAQKLLHPSFEHRKYYTAICKAEPDMKRTPELVVERLLAGVKLGDGKAKAQTVTARVTPQGLWELHLVVTEGRNHLIRRMCAAIGLSVTKLTRTGIGALRLSTMASGSFRVASAADIQRLTAK